LVIVGSARVSCCGESELEYLPTKSGEAAVGEDFALNKSRPQLQNSDALVRRQQACPRCYRDVGMARFVFCDN